MTLVNSALKNLEQHLPKVISPRAHGYIDYSHAAVFAAAGFVFWKKNKPAAVAAFATSAFILVQSLITDYPLGVSPIISFEKHGEIDTLFVPSAIALPRLLGFNDTPEAWFFRANGVAESFVVGMTDFSSGAAKLESAAETFQPQTW